MESAEGDNPLDHNVEAVLPGVHSRMSATHGEVAALRETVNLLQNQMQDLKDSQEEARQENANGFSSLLERDSAMASSLMSLGHFMQPSARTPTNFASQNTEQEEKEEQDEDQEEGGESSSIPIHHNMVVAHETLRGLIDEWYGLGDFKGVPIVGGIQRMEDEYKNKWRKHFENGRSRYFCRVKSIVQAIKVLQERVPDTSIDDVLIEMGPIYKDKCRSSVYNMVEWLKDQGILQRGQRRPRSTTT